MKRANTKLIGIFVFGAILLTIGSLFLFGSRDIFQKKRYFYAYFEQNVNGINVGAPIKFRGIEVGSVKSIVGQYDTATSIVTPRILLEFHPETLKGAKVAKGEYTLFQPLLQRGMRASLRSQSILTGQLYVSLDFYENKPIRNLGTEKDKYPEMPTIDSGLGEIFAAFEDLPLDALVVQITNTLDSLERVLSNEGFSQSANYLPTLLADIDATVNAIGNFTKSELPPTITLLRAILKTGGGSIEKLTDKLTNETLVTVDDSLKTLTAKLSQETLVDLSSALQQFEVTLAQLESTLGTVQVQVDPSSSISNELTTMLREIKAAASQLRTFTQYLELHPEALLRGR